MEGLSRRYQQSRCGRRTPWSEDGAEAQWPPLRVRIARLVMAQPFEGFMGLVTACNLGMIIYETDEEARCYAEFYGRLSECPRGSQQLMTLRAVNVTFILIYTLESLARGYVERWEGFYNTWNNLDFIAMVAGWLTEVVSSLDNLGPGHVRVFRVLRLARVFRIILCFGELYQLMGSLTHSLRTLFFGTLVLLLMRLLWSVLLVVLVHPVATLSLGVMVLVPSVIGWVMEAREKVIEVRSEQKMLEQAASRAELLRLCSLMDSDGRGTLSLADMAAAFDQSEAFQRVLELLGVQPDEIQDLFEVIDTLGSVEVNYKQFADHLYRLKAGELRASQWRSSSWS